MHRHKALVGASWDGIRAESLRLEQNNLPGQAPFGRKRRLNQRNLTFYACFLGPILHPTLGSHYTLICPQFALMLNRRRHQCRHRRSCVEPPHTNLSRLSLTPEAIWRLSALLSLAHTEEGRSNSAALEISLRNPRRATGPPRSFPARVLPPYAMLFGLLCSSSAFFLLSPET